MMNGADGVEDDVRHYHTKLKTSSKTCAQQWNRTGEFVVRQMFVFVLVGFIPLILDKSFLLAKCGLLDVKHKVHTHKSNFELLLCGSDGHLAIVFVSYVLFRFSIESIPMTKFNERYLTNQLNWYSGWFDVVN